METDRKLGEFLRARRELTPPARVDLPDAGSRRTPGLRREEVAMLIGVSTDYYVRLEQGRERNPSDQVIAALTEVFTLGADAVAHLYALARGPSPADPDPCPPEGATDEVSPHLIRLMDSWPRTPAFVINQCMETLALNPSATAFYERGLRRKPKIGNNTLRAMFLDPVAREFYADWESTARAKVAHFRATAGRNLHDPRVSELVDELTDLSPEFRDAWARYDVQIEPGRLRRFRHELVGELTVITEVFSLAGAPGQHLITFQAGHDRHSAEALEEMCREVT
ncbi:helix-turn-helix domain-containing protein [Herbidospora sp. NEAU-GS84]|uniref:Helix-turn-helix domain-containing protein n=1 Tax=Herbidospora solisilvae TaxID=2696284 RepID=A0A7C9MYS0_9ACTN|nr:helix-turn-helix transcriptional regulator [Herbidospora solisilvae]NAS24311.1 helix-turn-helix domain-containing protein [Herbidospora solisilvae]